MTGINIQHWIEDIGSDGPVWVLLIISIGWFLSLGSRLIYPVLLPQIMAEYDITYGVAGVTLSILWLSYALVSAPGGLIADRIGERALLVWSAIIATGGAVAVVVAPTFGYFLIATAILGVGTGLFGTTGTTVLTDVYSRRDTTAVSISQIAGTAGTIVLPVVAGAAAALAGWRLGVGYVIPGFLLVTVGLWYTVPERTSPAVGDNSRSIWEFLDALREPFSSAPLLLLVGGMTAIGFVYQGLSGFLPAYLIETKGLSQQTASVLFGLFFTSMIAAKLVSGPIAGRFGKRMTLLGYALVSTPAVIAYPLVESTAGLVTAVWFSGLILGYTPIATTYAMGYIPSAVQGTVFGIVRTTFLGVGALAPPLVGALADAGRFDLAIVGLGVVGGLSIAFSVLLPADR
jgi:MFS family permease